MDAIARATEGGNMRLIDIEKLRGCAIIRPHNGLEVKVIESFSDKIKHQDIQTAYDADKVIQEIEQLRVQYFLTIAGTGDKALDVAYEKVYQALESAMEIVKAGGKHDK